MKIWLTGLDMKQFFVYVLSRYLINNKLIINNFLWGSQKFSKDLLCYFLIGYYWLTVDFVWYNNLSQIDLRNYSLWNLSSSHDTLKGIESNHTRNLIMPFTCLYNIKHWSLSFNFSCSWQLVLSSSSEACIIFKYIYYMHTYLNTCNMYVLYRSQINTLWIAHN